MPDNEISIPVLTFVGNWILEILLALAGIIGFLINRKIDKNTDSIEKLEEETKGGFMAVSTTHKEIFRLVRELEKTRESSCVPRIEFERSMTEMSRAVIKIEQFSEILMRHLGEEDKRNNEAF